MKLGDFIQNRLRQGQGNLNVIVDPGAGRTHPPFGIMIEVRMLQVKPQNLFKPAAGPIVKRRVQVRFQQQFKHTLIMFECRVKIPVFLGFIGLLQFRFRFLQQPGHVFGPFLHGLLRYRRFGSPHFKTTRLLRVMRAAGKRQDHHQQPGPAGRPSKRVLFTRFETAYAGFAFHRERYPYRFAGAITGGLAFPPQKLPSGDFPGPALAVSTQHTDSLFT
ncbi:MAG: hypothetical protein BWX80_02163 [Candidatus Hydrogenedentes bacterium ADurb.Bin101]|nr:MAG: hypothetical protein BWX80_02163 [Candidatus Hydrogenedentes bacterium ADurb.Bin101]